MTTDSFYTDTLLAHARDTRFSRGLAGATHRETGDNPLCGDNLQVEILLKDDVVIDCGIQIAGCIIHQASTNMLLNLILNKQRTTALKLIADFLHDKTNDNYSSLAILHQVANNAARTKCVNLSWHTVAKALTNTNQHIINVLKTIRDPELPVNIYDLGLIYNITETNDACEITMTFTAPNCPAADYLLTEVRNKVSTVIKKTVTVNITFEPPWHIGLSSATAKLILQR